MGCISEPNNMDPDHVTSETGITGSNRESIYYLLNLRCGISSFYIYLYYIWSLYDANIQYVQLLYWAILVVHIYYSVSFVLGYSNRTNFYNKPIILYGSIFYFWFALVAQYYNDLYLYLVYSIDPVSFIYANCFLGLSINSYSYILPIFLG